MLIGKDNDLVTKAKMALLSMQRNSWEQGTAMQAFLECGDMEIVILMAIEAVNRRLPDGRAAVMGGSSAVTDPCSVGEALIAAYRQTNNEDLKRGYDELIEWALKKAPRTSTGVLYHLDNKNELWSDSPYMLPPFLAAAGYFDEALLNLYGYWDYLFDKNAKLMSHRWDDAAKSFVRKDNWGGGNGWTVAAIARVYDLLPGDRGADKKKLAEMGLTLIDGILSYVRSDFLFHDVVDDDQTFVETCLSQMLAYAIYRGIQSKWLDKSYLDKAEKLHAAATKKVDEYGIVRDCCGAPSFNKPGISPEAQAFFILMNTARSKVVS